MASALAYASVAMGALFVARQYFLSSYPTQDGKTHWQVTEQWVEPPPEVDTRDPAPAGYTNEPLKAELRSKIIGAELSLEEAVELQAKAVRGEID